MKDCARNGRHGLKVRLEIGFYTSLSTGSLRDSLLSFAQQHSHIDVNIVEDSRAMLVSLLDRGSIDIMIALGEPSDITYSHLGLWSERVVVALPKEHALAAREYVYWTDLKKERFLTTQRDPGPDIEDLIRNKLTVPGDRPDIKRVKASTEHILSIVAGNQGITVLCESGSGSAVSGIVFREIRDGNGPTRVGYVAFWRHDNDNPALTQMIAFLRSHPAVPQGATNQ